MKNRFAYIALVLSLILLVWLGGIYVQQHKLQIRYTKDVEHTYQVIITLRNCEQLLVDAETNQRGYILTHLESFKQPYFEAISKIDSVIDRLGQQVSDNYKQRAYVKLLTHSVTQRMETLKANLDLRYGDNHFTDKLKRGKLGMDKIRVYIQMMEDEEYTLLAYRDKEKTYYQKLNFSFLTFAFLMACLVCISSIALIIRELRTRIRFQKMLEKSLFELTRSNNEIEQITYAASHDLQEPLRKIRTLNSLLKKKLETKIAQEEEGIVLRIEKATERMYDLMDNLVDFTNLLNRSASNLSTVSLDVAATTAFEKVMKNKDVQLNKTTLLPAIQGYERQLNMLFIHLFDNAYKYRRPDKKLIISITCQIKEEMPMPGLWNKKEVKTYYEIVITDNGMGFDNQFNEKIFQIFQRLHTQSQYSGKGIGLAIARRVMTNHYGYIEARGAKDSGASFTIYFPVS